MNDFRTIATALAPHVSGNTYGLLDAADAVLAVVPNLDATKPAPDVVIPDDVVYRVARGNDDVCEHMRQGKRINAIKALRALFAPSAGARGLVGLKQAKQACEGDRWDDVYNIYANLVPQGDPWATHSNDEPPF